jgi:glycosyltransferase involved in cell wall biosynthesis
VHHVTFVNYWLPSFLALLPVTFVWGPVGGGESAPRAFYQTFSWRGRVYEHLRSIARWFGEHDPLVRMTAKRARAAFATTSETAARLRKLGAHTIHVLSQAALPEEEIEFLATLPLHEGNPFRFLSVGRLLHLKGFSLGLKAFSEFATKFAKSEYWVIGDGPERERLEHLAARLGVEDKVRFWGSVPRQTVLARLADCDVLVHPSLHDSGGWVCLEAMAAGRPVICLDLGGPALQVTNDTGFKIPADNPQQVVTALKEAMIKIASDSQLFLRMSHSSRARAREAFNWEMKQKWIRDIYDKVL